MKSLEEIWYSRNPQNERNLSTGENMFFNTVKCVFADYMTNIINDKIKEIEKRMYDNNKLGEPFSYSKREVLRELKEEINK